MLHLLYDNKNSNTKRIPFLYHLPVVVCLFFAFILINDCNSQPANMGNSDNAWVGAWSTAPQLVEPRNMPPEPGLANNTLRQVVCVSLGGDSLRVRFSNEFSTSAVKMRAVHLALSVGESKIDTGTDQAIKFNGNTEVTIEPGKAITSDPFLFKVKPRSLLAITIYYGDTSPDVTGHPGSRTTSYIMPGNHISDLEMPEAATTDHWYTINGIDIIAPDAKAVVVLGNSITDGRGSGTNKQNRWPDELAKRLLANPDTRNVAVLNLGIGGNCVLRQCLGPSALDRFERDVLNQYNVHWLIILEGINDIGQAHGSEGSGKVASDLIHAYIQMIDSAHTKNMLVYGATLLPFGGSFYDSPDHEKARTTVNEWIRTSGRFDAVIDLEAALRDPSNPLQLLPAADTGDHLHPNENGHRMMGEAVDLNLFN